MKFVIQINKLNLVTSDKVSQQDLLKKTYRSRFTGEMIFKVKQTPLITDDSDTICFIKYFLHNLVKRNLLQTKYDEMMEVDDLVKEFKDYEPFKGRENVSPSQSSEEENSQELRLK